MTDHTDHTEKPMCSLAIENQRLRRATRSPVRAQKTGSSGRQSSIQWLRGAGTRGTGRSRPTRPEYVDTVRSADPGVVVMARWWGAAVTGRFRCVIPVDTNSAHAKQSQVAQQSAVARKAYGEKAPSNP